MFFEKVKFRYCELPIKVGSIIEMYMIEGKYTRFKLIEKIGGGSTGTVYLIEENVSKSNNPRYLDNKKKYVIKISEQSQKMNLRYELEVMYHMSTKYGIDLSYKPLFYGNFADNIIYGIIFPYVGKYNLDTVFNNNLIIPFTQNILIIKQLLSQLKSLKNMVHGDFKPSNIILDIGQNNVITTIIDYGLTVDINTSPEIYSTNYITSPESLLTHKYKYLVPEYQIDISKHDYCGLFFSVLNLFYTHNFYQIIVKYFKKYYKVDYDSLGKQDGLYYYIYFWYKSFYSDIDSLPNEYYKKMIIDMEKTYPKLTNYNYYSFDWFYADVICIYLDPKKFNKEKISSFKDFLIKICHFDPNKRATIDELEQHPFLSI